MKTKHTISTLFVISVLVSTARLGHGQGIIRQHLGATDPASEGFTLNLAPGGTVGPVTNDLGRDSWSVTSGGFPANYFLSLTAEEQASVAGQDLAFSATFRIVQSPNIWMGLYAGSQRFSLGFDSQLDGDPIVLDSKQIPLFVLDGGGSGYHEYQLTYHAATGQAALWVDGVERVSDINGVSGSFGWGGFWGAFQGAASQANWNRVSLETIPEPSAISLILLGSGLLIYVRRNTRKHCRA